MITYKDVKNNEEVQVYIKQADQALKVIGLTEHSFAHTGIVAANTEMILKTLNYDSRTIELGKIAALLHDIGNVINRANHAHHGALIAHHILDKMGMSPEETAQIVLAIGYHDEGSAHPITPINSALIIADKCDVRATRVRDFNQTSWDIHDRVNFAVKKANLQVCPDEDCIKLDLTIDTDIISISEYFEIFLGRMNLVRDASAFFGFKFKLSMNGVVLL